MLIFKDQDVDLDHTSGLASCKTLNQKRQNGFKKQMESEQRISPCKVEEKEITYLAINSHSNDVRRDQQHPEDQAQRPTGEIVRPILQDQLQCHQVRGHGHRIIGPVVPSQGETERIINEPTSTSPFTVSQPPNLYHTHTASTTLFHRPYPAKVQKLPAIGTNAAISPNDSMVMKTIAPTMA